MQHSKADPVINFTSFKDELFLLAFSSVFENGIFGLCEVLFIDIFDLHLVPPLDLNLHKACNPCSLS